MPVGGSLLLGMILPHLLQLFASQGLGVFALVGLERLPCKYFALAVHKIAKYIMVADAGQVV